MSSVTSNSTINNPVGAANFAESIRLFAEMMREMEEDEAVIVGLLDKMLDKAYRNMESKGCAPKTVVCSIAMLQFAAKSAEKRGLVAKPSPFLKDEHIFLLSGDA